MTRTLLVTLLTLVAAHSTAAVLSFDDIPAVQQNGYGPIGTYGGYTFGCIDCTLDRLDWVDTVGSPWPYGAHSDDFTMLNNMGGTGIIRSSSGSHFTFDGLWAETWFLTSARAGWIRGFDGGSEVWSSAIILGPQFAYFGGMPGAIDELRLELGNNFLVDDLALSAVSESSQPVPEPASLALLGLGLGALGAITRRGRRAGLR